MTWLWELCDVSLGARLHRVTARIDAGVTAIIGPSGAGKTSLVDLLVGFERPTAGRIERAGAATTPAWVPSDDGLWPHLSARAHLTTVTQTDRTVDELLDAFGLAARAEVRPAELSRGERARLAVARALATGARALVMDEPLAHVDPEQHERTWRALLERVAATGASLVFASHDPTTVLRAADRVLHLDAGRLTFEGATAELYERPPTRALALALGPANWVEPVTAERFLGARPASRCVRPERVVVEPDEGAAVVVEEIREVGGVADVAVRHVDGERARFLCRAPVGAVVGARVRLRALTLLAALLALVPGCGHDDPTLTVSALHHRTLPPDGPLAPAPRAVAPGADGELLVLDNAGRVLVLDSGGAVTRQWRMPDVAVGKPEGICRLRDGRVVVADTHYHRLVVFDGDGAVLGTIGDHGIGPGQFLYPVRVIQDPQGFLYVAEYGSNDRVQKLTADGAFVLAFGRFGTAPGELQRATGLVWHEGHVLVADAVNQRVQEFTDDGVFVGVLGGDAAPSLSFPYDIALGPDGLLWVAEYGAGRVTALTLGGVVVGRFGSPGTGDAELATPWALTAVARGDRTAIWVTDTGNRRLVTFER